MFWRILWRLLYASRRRLALAFLAVASGAAVSAALLNLDLDANDKLTREFRTLGANVVVSNDQGGDTASLDDAVMSRIAALHPPELVAAAPYLYLVAQAGPKQDPLPVIVAGTWLDQVARMDSWWKVEGSWISDRDDRRLCMIGEQAARSLALHPGSQVAVRYADKEVELTVAGVVTTGGSEDSQLFVALPLAQEISGLHGKIGLAQLSVRGTPPVIESVIKRLSDDLPGLQVQPVRQLAAAEGNLFARISSLFFVTISLILILSTFSVLASMAGLAMERRTDVGLMKALGGSVRRVMRFFLAEATIVGAAGGCVGCGVGILLASWIGRAVFDAPITPRLVVFPITLALMIAVALAGAFPLRLLGRVRPAEILRGE